MFIIRDKISERIRTYKSKKPVFYISMESCIYHLSCFHIVCPYRKEQWFLLGSIFMFNFKIMMFQREKTLVKIFLSKLDRIKIDSKEFRVQVNI